MNRFTYQLTPNVSAWSRFPRVGSARGLFDPNSDDEPLLNSRLSTRAPTSTAPKPPCSSGFFGRGSRVFFSPVITYVPLTYQPSPTSGDKSPSSTLSPRRCVSIRIHSALTEAGPGTKATSTPVRRRSPFTRYFDEKNV